MERIEKTVFLSYRRTNAPWALAIFQHLTHHGYDVFFDFMGISSGDFERVIVENIRARAHFLILLTPSALERCQRPDDWLRREIETALDLRRNVVPLMLEGFDFNTPRIADQLTGRIAPLKLYNALSVPVEYFEEAMSRLRDRYLNVPLAAVLHPISSAAQDIAAEQRNAAASAPAVDERELTAQEYFERAFEAADPAETRRFYNQAIQLKPDFADAFYNRALLREEQGDVDGAREDYDRAIQLQPNHAWAITNRALLRAAHGDVIGAMQDHDAVIRLQPGDPEVFYNRGLLRAEHGDATGARNDYDRAIELRPDDPDAYLNRGILRAEQGDAVGAREDYDRAIQRRPNDADAFYNRASLRAEAGDSSGARTDYDRVIQLQPTYAEALFNRALLREEQGDVAGAIEDYAAVIRLHPYDADAFYNRALLRTDQGDATGAREDYEQAARLKR